LAGDHGVTAPIDVHLMVSPVDRIVGDFIDAGASYITFHPEATNHIDRSLQQIRQGGCKSGLVFNPSTSLDYCKYVMDKIDIILLMSVNPGFGGQAFIPAVLDKAKIARKMIDDSGYNIRLGHPSSSLSLSLSLSLPLPLPLSFSLSLSSGYNIRLGSPLFLYTQSSE
jgi:ribulose-phosphate 3-epimerase